MVELALAFGACPGSSIPEASQSAFAAKAAYRFFSNDDIRAESILASHVLSTQRRMLAGTYRETPVGTFGPGSGNTQY